MATMTLTVPDPIVQDVVDAFADAYGYQAEIDDGEGNQIPNPETDIQFAKRMIREYVKNVYKGHQAKLFEAGRQAVLDTADDDVAGVDMS